LLMNFTCLEVISFANHKKLQTLHRNLQRKCTAKEFC
jgi:hypothetical protein